MDSDNLNILLKKSGHDKEKLYECSICKKKITKSEIGGFKKGSYDIFCSRVECLVTARSLDLVR
jgi:hypothetical protein